MKVKLVNVKIGETRTLSSIYAKPTLEVYEEPFEGCAEDDGIVKDVIKASSIC